MNPRTLISKKPAPPPVRVTYSLVTAASDKVTSQAGSTLTVKY